MHRAFFLRALLLGFAASSLLGCAPERPVARLAVDRPAQEHRAAADAPRGPLYSPWVVRVDDERARVQVDPQAGEPEVLRSSAAGFRQA